MTATKQLPPIRKVFEDLGVFPRQPDSNLDTPANPNRHETTIHAAPQNGSWSRRTQLQDQPKLQPCLSMSTYQRVPIAAGPPYTESFVPYIDKCPVDSCVDESRCPGLTNGVSAIQEKPRSHSGYSSGSSINCNCCQAQVVIHEQEHRCGKKYYCPHCSFQYTFESQLIE
jgi:hypothetical protein